MLFVALAAAAPTPESSVYAWADKCPSTAISAGLYSGEAHMFATFAGSNVLRLTTKDAGASPGGSFTETLWMLGEACRAVGLVEWGSKQGGTHLVSFVVAKEAGAPTAAEQVALLEWAGRVAWEPGRADQAVATDLFAKPTAEKVQQGTLSRRGGRVWRDGAPPEQVAAWRPADGSPEVGVCPCYEVARPGVAAAVTENGRMWRVYRTMSGSAAALRLEPARWAVEPRPPSKGTPIPGPAAAGIVASSWDEPPTLVAVDAATGASFTLVTTGPFGWTSEGITYGGGVIDVATVRRWLAE
jgi:hypothetical protein